MNTRAWSAAALMLLLLAAGCSSGSNEVSQECTEAMARTAAETDVSAADPLIERTLDVCVDAVEWIAALQQHPEAMGLKSPDFVDDFAVYTACGNDRVSRVCADAAERGVLD